MSALGQADIREHLINVRFTPKSGRWNSVAKCPLCAKSGHCRSHYWISDLQPLSNDVWLESERIRPTMLTKPTLRRAGLAARWTNRRAAHESQAPHRSAGSQR